MADCIRAKGVIIKQTDYGEGNRIINIFAENMGIIKAVSYGAKKAKSRRAASSQFLCWGEFELMPGGGEMMTLKNIDLADGFLPIGEDIVKLSLCVYLSDITYAMLGMNNADNRLLRVFLNTLYALAYRNEPTLKVKSVYELKLMTIEGYAPETDKCGVCGSPSVARFDAQKGTMLCKNCAHGGTVMNEGVYKALRYIVHSDDRKMLSFIGNDSLYEQLGEISEKYVLTHADRSFKSLGYFKAMLGR